MEIWPNEVCDTPRGGRGFCVAQLAISAPQSPVNKFTVLTIEDSNTIDSELANAPPLTSLTPAPLRKPKWERRLPKLLSISALDAQGTSLLLPVEIGTTDTSELYSIKALLDSRVTGRRFPQQDRTDLQGHRHAFLLQDSLQKDAFGRLWT